MHSKSSVYVQVMHFLYEKKTASNFVLDSLLFFFKRYRRMAKPNLCNLIIQNYVNQKGNDVSYFGNSSCPRSQPHRYKYSYLLLHRYNLPRFRKDQNHSRRYLKKRNKRRKFRCGTAAICPRTLMYISKLVFFVLFVFFCKRSHTEISIITFIHKLKITVEHGKRFTGNRGYSCKMQVLFSERK